MDEQERCTQSERHNAVFCIDCEFGEIDACCPTPCPVCGGVLYTVCFSIGDLIESDARDREQKAEIRSLKASLNLLSKHVP